MVVPAAGALQLTTPLHTHLMLREPPVRRLRGSVHRALHVPEVRRLVAARSVTAPPVLATRVHLIVECVIDGDVGVRCGLCGKASPTRLVDAAHVLLELIAMIITIEVVARDKQVRVDHLMLPINNWTQLAQAGC